MRQFQLIFRQLTRPLSYLQVKHPDKWVYDWAVPAIFTALMTAYCAQFVSLESIFSSQGLVSKLNSVISTLPGFFIAALAAVATFGRSDIDDIMDHPPKIEILKGEHLIEVEMTRRRYLSVLFAYLTAISLIISVCGYFITESSVIPDDSKLAIFAASAIYFFIVSQMIVATIQGLY